MEHEKNMMCSIEVRSYELDAYGHVNNAVYLNYLEYARHRFLDETGFPYEQFRHMGYGLYVAGVNIRYLSPAFLGDTLNIATTCVKMRMVKGTLEQIVLRGETVIAKALVDFATVDGKGRPAPMPPEIRDAWSVVSDCGAG